MLAPRPSPLAASRGFTLVEMLVSVALFAVVMVVCVGALLSLVGANKKAQALQSVMNNLNVSIDSMMRTVRTGRAYHCGDSSHTLNSCAEGQPSFSFAPYGAPVGDLSKRIVYAYVQTGTSGCVTQIGTGGCIMKSVDGGSTYSQMTSSDVSITDMTFFVSGTSPFDDIQPEVVIVILGTAGDGTIKVSTSFHLQATALQRILDL
jgi:prepilin-type N-terminal cleavage/methylation domain-containing protein